MTHEQFRELLPLYVIGALDGEELRDFERYVGSNRERCTPEIADFQTVADQLAFAAPSAQPSAEVFDRVMAGIGEPEPSRVPVRAPVAVTRERFDWSALFSGWIPWAATAVVATVLVITTGQLRSMTQRYRDQLDENAKQRSALMQQNARISDLSSNVEAQAKQFKSETDQLRVTNTSLQQDVDALKIANAKLAAEKTDLLRVATELRQQISMQNQQIALLKQGVDEQTDRLALFMDPSTRVAQMADPKGQTKATARIYWHDVKKSGVLVASSLQPVLKGQDKCLELWAICGNEAPVPAGLFWTDNTGHGVLEIKLAKQMACVDKFAVTIEPASGVPAPTGSMILLGP